MRVCAFLCLFGGIAQANPAAIDWLVTETTFPQNVQFIGQWTPRGTELIGVDSLTYSPSYGWPYFAIPRGSAEFYVLVEAESDRNAKAVLVFGPGTPVCGEDLGTMPVDTGTGAFLDRAAATALDKLATKLSDRNHNLYDNWMAPIIDDAYDFAQFFDLPGGTTFPAFSTGWGDGGYPVASLIDADGNIIAIYADFMGRSFDGDWLLPPPCTKDVS